MFSIPEDLARDILSQWLCLENLAAFDSAVSKSIRPILLAAYASTSNDGSINDTDIRGQIYQWVARRRIKLKCIAVVGKPNFDLFDSMDKSQVEIFLVENVYSNLSRLINGCPMVKRIGFLHSSSSIDDLDAISSVIFNQLIDITLRGSSITDKIIEALQRRASNLVRIDAYSKCEVSTENWCRLIEVNPKLVSLELDGLDGTGRILLIVLQHCRVIEHLKLNAQYLGLETVPDIIAFCALLKSLEISNDWKHMHWSRDAQKGCELEVQSLDLAILDRIFTASEYSRLHLGYIDTDTDMSIKPLMLYSASTLRDLYIDCVPRLFSEVSMENGQVLHDILMECTQLENLTLSMWDQWVDSDFQTAFQDPVNIVDLYLMCNIHLSTDMTIRIISMCPKLLTCRIASKNYDIDRVQEVVGSRVKVVLHD